MARTAELKIRLEKSDMDELIDIAKRRDRSVSEMGAVIVMDWLHGAARRLQPVEYQSDRTLSKTRRLEIIKRDGHTCQLCLRGPLPQTECHIDHIKQRHMGGGNDDANLRLLCADCNQKRSRVKTAK